MILQLVMGFIPVFIAGFIFYLTCMLSTLLKNMGGEGLLGLGRVLVCTPALNAFFTFVLQAVVATASVCFFRQVSNHGVMSLDILYFISMLMLILYHALKEFAYPLMKQA